MHAFSIENFKKYKIEILFGFALAIILFDRFRFGGRIGLGEVLLAAVAYISFLIIMLNFSKIRIDNIGIKYSLLLNLFLLLCMIPNTIWSTLYSDYPGSSILELFAYTSCFVFLLTISLLRLNHNVIGAVAVFVSVSLSYAFLGNTEAWYGDVRFSGGSNNPNRLAIYLLSSVVIISQLQIRSVQKFILFAIISLLILITLSDAARLGFIAMFLSFIFLSGYRSRYILPIYLCIAFLLTVFISINFNALYLLAIDLWYAASNSNMRFNLIVNGIQAWTEHPLTILIGHGSGAFSGYLGPYEGWESHSNIVDILSIGGIVGFSLFYIPIIYSIFHFHKGNNHFAASALIGLLIFSFFAFIARHPIIWFAIYISLMNSSTLTTNAKR